jgi:hypothetical protein
MIEEEHDRVGGIEQDLGRGNTRSPCATKSGSAAHRPLRGDDD